MAESIVSPEEAMESIARFKPLLEGYMMKATREVAPVADIEFLRGLPDHLSLVFNRLCRFNAIEYQAYHVSGLDRLYSTLATTSEIKLKVIQSLNRLNALIGSIENNLRTGEYEEVAIEDIKETFDGVTRNLLHDDMDEELNFIIRPILTVGNHLDWVAAFLNLPLQRLMEERNQLPEEAADVIPRLDQLIHLIRGALQIVISTREVCRIMIPVIGVGFGIWTSLRRRFD